MLWMQRKVIIRILYVIRDETGSQWRDCKTGVMWTVRGVLEISLAAEFCSFWSRDNSFMGRFTRTELQLSIRDVTKAWMSVSVRTGVMYLDKDLML